MGDEDTPAPPDGLTGLPPFGSPWWVQLSGAICGVLVGWWIDDDGVGVWVAVLSGALIGSLVATGIWGSIRLSSRPDEAAQWRAAVSDDPEQELERAAESRKRLEQLPPASRTYLSLGCFPTFLLGAAIGLFLSGGSWWALLTVPVGAVVGLFIYSTIGTFAMSRLQKRPPEDAS